MSSELTQLLHESLLNNSYDYDAMHDQLKSSWMHSFSYLYALQHSHVEYAELFYHSNDDISHDQSVIGTMYIDKLIRACFDVEYDMIKTCKREKYYRSKFYNKEIKFIDLVENPDIFLKLPIVMIDNNIVWDYSLKFNGDTTKIILPFGRQLVLEDIRTDDDKVIYIDHHIQFLIVRNQFYTSIRIDSSNLEVISENIVRINKELLFNVTEFPDLSTGKFFVTFNFPDIFVKTFKLGTNLLEVTNEDEEYYYINVDNTTMNYIYNSNIVYMNFIFIPNLLSHNMYDNGINEITVKDDGTCNFMVIESSPGNLHLDPIPIENFMIFRKDSVDSEWGLVDHDIVLKMYYPNIYEIVDPEKQAGMVYRIYYFYDNLDDMKYHVKFDFYYKYLTDIFTDISMEEIVNTIYFYNGDETGFPLFDELTDSQKELFIERFKEIISYKYYNYQYGESDFINRWSIIEGNEGKAAFEYLDETLRDWIKDDPDILRKYVLRQKKLGTTYTLFTNIINLSERLREDASIEFPKSTIIFPEERYVFALENSRNDGKLLNARIFVDGICITDFYQMRKRYVDYFYIPASMVTDDSMIDIEVFPYYSFDMSYRFTSVYDTLEIDLTKPEVPVWATISDLYVADTSNTGGKVDVESTRIRHGVFEVIEHYDRGDEVVEKLPDDKHEVEFTRLKKFSIKPKREDVLEKDLHILFNKLPHWYPFKYEGEERARILIEFNDYELNWNFGLKYMRIFKNGRLMPRSHYIFQYQFSKPRIYFIEFMDPGDVIYIDITPYKYKEVYYREELDEGETLIDLSDYITKPFDIRYYDVYLNGRKLNIANVFAITPWKITLTNIKTRYNLQIFERERDWEYFGLDCDDVRYPYTIDNLVNEEFVSNDEKFKIIKDKIDSLKDHRLTIKENTDEEEKIEYDMSEIRINAQAYFFYYDELIPKNYVNPDVLQFNGEVMEEIYDKIDETYKYQSFEHPNDLNYPDSYMLDPDIYIEGLNPEASEYSNCVFMVGHSNIVPIEKLTDTIVIDNDSPYYTNRLNDIYIRISDSGVSISDTVKAHLEYDEFGTKIIKIDDNGAYYITGAATNIKIDINDTVIGKVALIFEDLSIDDSNLDVNNNPIIYVGNGVSELDFVPKGYSILISAGINSTNIDVSGVIVSSDGSTPLTLNIYRATVDTVLRLVDGLSSEEFDYQSNVGNDSGYYITGEVVFNDIRTRDE